MAIISTDIYAIKYGFIDKKFVETACQILKIKLDYLMKSK